MSAKLFLEQKTKVIKPDKRFKHVMALTLNPKSSHREGVLRCITSREGEEGVSGQIDRSVLYKVQGETLKSFRIKDELHIKYQYKVIKKISEKGQGFLGLEDPDIWIDEKTNYIHLYFTLPFLGKSKSRIHLGHAWGKDLDNLEMTMPVLVANKKYGAKEVSIAPLNKKGVRYNLIESSDKIADTTYSVVRTAVASQMGKPWKFGKIVFHPAKHKLRWIAGHASPGPLLPVSFINIGSDRRVGFMNGCEANKVVKGKTKYGTFSIGLFIYNFEKGEIEWVSPKAYIQDSEASKTRAITFASQFVETGKGEGIVYAHVNDSFVRAYVVKSRDIRKLLPKDKTD